MMRIIEYAVLLCLLGLANVCCVSSRSAKNGAPCPEFLWGEPLKEAGAHRDVTRDIAESARRSQYEQVADLARLLGSEGIVRSYRMLYVSLRKPPLGIGIEWYIRTRKRVVFLLNAHEVCDRLEEEGHPGLLVVFVDEKTAAAFEDRIALAHPFGLESARNTGSSGYNLSFFSVQEGSRVAECEQYNLVPDEGTPETLSAAGVERAFDWLREQLLEEPAERQRPNGDLDEPFK